ncbi:unnamed protein product (macronuclear) [Paramecium tetraurelia]|uniref:Uncharacterized protein n=1 Tax=Paramecium tetraurelia TaxID=5888 RepID=A0DHI6_PARTE|nr:uncharacterized protein GSPATT00016890001 [Paramecium tetraurelia]CAK82503.1 unnamed protein product [Paramecium tetraurelia]|eukprot:XP_001449900.1 hypothetical protein (macronuclear) [Paramecium tetraurelia strain d4-2]
MISKLFLNCSQLECCEMEDDKQSAKATSKKIQNRKIWSQKEDKLLERAIHELGTNWKEVAKYLYNRNPSQCAQRWKRIKPQRSRHSWSAIEDEQLLELVKIHKRNWGMIASIMHWRTGKQIRERFINKLNPEIRAEPWSKEEDLIVMDAYQKYGSRWTEISKLLNGRPENMIKNRFYSFIRKEYMNIQNPYYVIPNSQQKTDTDQLKSSQQLDEILQQDPNDNSQSSKSSIIKRRKNTKVQKKKMKKQKVVKRKKEQEQKFINNIVNDQNEQVLNEIISAESSEVQVKEEDDNEIQVNKIGLSILSQSVNNNLIQINNQLNSQQLFNDSIISLYNSQVLFNQTSQSQQNQQHQYATAMLLKQEFANLMKSQSLMQSQLMKESNQIQSNPSSQETRQSSLLQLSLSSMSFLQFPCVFRQESFPQSMYNSQQ